MTETATDTLTAAEVDAIQRAWARDETEVTLGGRRFRLRRSVNPTYLVAVPLRGALPVLSIEVTPGAGLRSVTA